MNRSPHDPEKTMALDARKLADSIAKLSRAAAIHMIFATQKLETKAFRSVGRGFVRVKIDSNIKACKWLKSLVRNFAELKVRVKFDSALFQKVPQKFRQSSAKPKNQHFYKKKPKYFKYLG